MNTNRIFKNFSAIAACLILTSATSQTTIGTHIATAHTSPGFNDSNPGLYVRFENGFTAGSYFNSERRQSSYAGVTFPVFDGAFDVSVLALSGYLSGVVPAVVPSKRVNLGGGFSARLSLLAPPKSTAAFHFSLEKEF